MNGDVRKLPSKRRYEDSTLTASSSKKKASLEMERIPQPKNTVAMLNELRNGLVYKLVSQTGTAHMPLFTISVEVDGQKYLGQGSSKKSARIEAAAAVLRNFIQFKEGAVLTPLKAPCNLDFTNDEHLNNDINDVNKYTNTELVAFFENFIQHAKPVKKIQPLMQCDLYIETNNSKTAITSDGPKKVPDKGPVALTTPDSQKKVPDKGPDLSPHPLSSSPEDNNNMNGDVRKFTSKQRYEDSTLTASSSKKKASLEMERIPQPKNTVAMLNELRYGLVYKLVSQTGPAHMPLFTISVEVDGQKYLGQGSSKKSARIEAAAAVLRSFVQFKEGAVLTPLKAPCNLDFTNDEHLNNGINDVNKYTNTVLVAFFENFIQHAKPVKKIQPLMQCDLYKETNNSKTAITPDGPKKVPDKGPVALTTPDSQKKVPDKGPVALTTPDSQKKVPDKGPDLSPHPLSSSPEDNNNMNGDVRKLPSKRRYEDSTLTASSSKKKASLEMERIPQPKNTVAMLNELRNGLVYKLVSQTGTAHMPLFTISVEVDGQKYLGQGSSKKSARIEAAAAVLRNFIQFKEGAVLTPLKAPCNLDFTNDEYLNNDINDVNKYTNTELVAFFENFIQHAKPVKKIQPLMQCDLYIETNNSKTAITPDGPKKVPDKGPIALTTPDSQKKVPDKGPVALTTPDSQKKVPDKGLVALLYELYNDVHFECSTTDGAQNNCPFKMTVTVKNSKFDGTGPSKKLAKNAAAKAALVSLRNISYSPMMHPQKNVALPIDEKSESMELSTPDSQKKVPDKGPVALLYELYNDVHFDCSTTDGAQNNCPFKMTVTVKNSKFDGTGPSKKLAKNAAAKAALVSLLNISYSPMMQPQKSVALPIDEKSESMELSQIHADTIGHLVLEKFMEVLKGQEPYSRHKVLAGIVMTENMNFNEAKVISVSTGTKCVSGDHMSVNGAVVNDSHAEIVSRRCLIKYLYDQLELQCSQATANQSIFVRNPDNGQYPYKLKSSVHFHLYISTAPCGDARIFSPHENDTGVDTHPKRKARGQLRTKIESGEGTIPVKSSDGIQTWDGVLQGQRLLTMSCSDKIARWNIVGIQGSLLASIIKPIYLHSIVLGSLLHPEHMYRAVCGRIENSIQGLPPPYHLNKPRLALVTSAEPRNQAKAPIFSVNWTIGDTEVEVVNSQTGKTVNNQISRITKQVFFMKFGYLMKNLPAIQMRKVQTDYGETKQKVKDYQIAKNELFSAFRREDLGNWLKKPIEQDEFALPE